MCGNTLQLTFRSSSSTYSSSDVKRSFKMCVYHGNESINYVGGLQPHTVCCGDLHTD